MLFQTCSILLLSLQAGIHRVTQAIADQVDGQRSRDDAQAGSKDHVGISTQEALAGADHGAPLGHGSGNTEAQEAQSCDTQNDVGNAFWKTIGWTKREDLNYYDFTLNEKNITEFNK